MHLYELMRDDEGDLKVAKVEKRGLIPKPSKDIKYELLALWNRTPEHAFTEEILVRHPKRDLILSVNQNGTIKNLQVDEPPAGGTFSAGVFGFSQPTGLMRWEKSLLGQYRIMKSKPLESLLTHHSEKVREKAKELLCDRVKNNWKL